MNPKASSRYVELLEQYRSAHRDGLPGHAAEKLFVGNSTLRWLPTIRTLANRVGAKTMLDYGAGKGAIYSYRDFQLPSKERAQSVQQYLGLDAVTCFDPAVPAHDTLSDGKFDLVICVDVLEHCPAEDMPWIVNEIFEKARRAVFANIAAYPAAKVLANGENAHATQWPVGKWRELVEGIASRHAGKAYHIVIQSTQMPLRRLLTGTKYRETLLSRK